MLSGGAHTGGFTRDGPAPSKELCRLPEPAVWRFAADWGRAGLVGVGGRRHRRNFGDMNDSTDHPTQLGELPVTLHFVTIVAIGHLPPAASVGAECAGFSARCLRLVHGTALPQTLLRSRDVWGARTALESCDLAIGARAGAQWRGRRAGGSGGCERGRGSGAHRPAPGAAVTSKRGPGAARMTTHAALLRRR